MLHNISLSNPFSPSGSDLIQVSKVTRETPLLRNPQSWFKWAVYKVVVGNR